MPGVSRRKKQLQASIIEMNKKNPKKKVTRSGLVRVKRKVGKKKKKSSKNESNPSLSHSPVDIMNIRKARKQLLKIAKKFRLQQANLRRVLFIDFCNFYNIF